MADVFVSYKKEDFAQAERLAACLRSAQLSVWWDERLTPESSWDATIQAEIEAASTVVVLWTPRSVSSEWVRTEAHFAQERGKLVPVLMEDCQVPIAFMLRQTIRLTTWKGESDTREWRKLLTWIGDLKSGSQSRPGQSPATDAAARNPFRDQIGQLASGDPVFDGALVNAATPRGTAFRDSAKLPVMRIVPGGAFLLGSTSADPDRTPVEGPQRRIEIPAPFALGVYPVLVSEFREVTGGLPAPAAVDTGRQRPWSLWKPRAAAPAPQITFVDSAPVTMISFDDAQAFVEQLSRATGERYRVPSETEWEYACRAGSQTRYAFGDQLDHTAACFGARSGPDPAGGFRPNAFGLHDMHGNVREWTADLWHESYEATPLDGSPASDGHGSMRVVRGGGWCDDAVLLRSAARMRATQSARSPYIGLRVARALG